MQTKLEKVFRVVLKAAGSELTRFEAAEIAQHLLKRNRGDLPRSLIEAAHPFKIHGRFTY